MSSSPGSKRTDPLGLIGQTLDERYQILELVDEGGYGYIYKAQRALWDKPVAVKFFKQRSTDPKKRERATKAFIAEGAVLNELSRKTTAIVQSFDIGTLSRGDGDQLLYMALEWLQGSTLKQLIDDERAEAGGDASWSIERVIDTVQPVAVALAVAHGSGVAHRDIKPANIFLVEASGSVEATTKLLDFGIAKVVEDLAEGFDHTDHREGPFTAKYGAPEQFAKRHGATGPWSDVYSLAMVCLELLAGRYPLRAEGFGSLIFAVCNPDERPTPRALDIEVTDELEAVFDKALRVSSDERYRDAGLFWRAVLEATGISAATFPVALGGRSTTMTSPPAIDFARAAGPSPTLPPPPKRARWLLSVAGAALLGAIATGAVLLGSGKQDTPTIASASATPGAPATSESIAREKLTNFGTLPEAITTTANPLSEEKIRLGRMLFYDKRLSKNDDVSCNSCHALDHHGVDGKRVSTGTSSQAGLRNSPTVYNAAGGATLMWDGRAANIEVQALLPLLNPKEHGLTEEEVIARLQAIEGYRNAFAAAFPEKRPAITLENVGKALGAFERKLVTPDRWDAYIDGKEDALTSQEKVGFNLFFETGCPTCHVGPYLGMSMSQKLGLMYAWPTGADRGLFEETKKPEHMLVFRVPTLRNVVDTAPYLHDGSIANLEQIVTMMAYHQLGKKLDVDQVKAMVAWLAALSGQLPAAYIEPPVLPD